VVQEPVSCSEHSGAATLVLYRPGARNAITSTPVEALHAALDRAAVADTVRVVVPTGADPAFCAGPDIEEFARAGRPPATETVLTVRLGSFVRSTVVPHTELPAVVQWMAEGVADRDPAVVRGLHGLWRSSRNHDLPDARDHEYTEPERRAAGAQLVPTSPIADPAAG
jgi:enoyl-CoA hydratase/carnithine racemase